MVVPFLIPEVMNFAIVGFVVAGSVVTTWTGSRCSTPPEKNPLSCQENNSYMSNLLNFESSKRQNLAIEITNKLVQIVYVPQLQTPNTPPSAKENLTGKDPC